MKTKQWPRGTIKSVLHITYFREINLKTIMTYDLTVGGMVRIKTNKKSWLVLPKYGKGGDP